MINFYIDDSGSINMNDKKQPIVLFSALCIPGDIYIAIKNDMDKLLNNILEDIKAKLIRICSNSGEFTEQHSATFANYFLGLIVKDKFEIHCADIIRGDSVYMLFESSDREQYLIDILNLVKKYNIKIISVYCDKLQYKKSYPNLSASDIETEKNSNIANCLIKSLTEHLKSFQEQGCIIVDEGNLIIEKVLIPDLQSGKIELESENLSRDVKQVKSHEYSLVQMADVAAYITNLNLATRKKNEMGITVSDKNKSRSIKFFDVIESNNLIINILPQEELEEEFEEKLIKIV